ncbi:SWI/SNF complex subunit SMARCC2 [Striga asiatica]|uniref:SWI/SNF complex subunit SMARCC2 n=1 Tax=Striga asiatica TaxID=4170 RepID=A0A5A7PEK7_STRAF|nr:SWI/SNF complex subunit SMARCC2 [Striga asiatica]
MGRSLPDYLCFTTLIIQRSYVREIVKSSKKRYRAFRLESLSADHEGSTYSASVAFWVVRMLSDLKEFGYNMEAPKFPSVEEIADAHEKLFHGLQLLSIRLMVKLGGCLFGPRVAAACAHASLASLSKDIDKEESSNGGITRLRTNGPASQHDTEGVQLSTEKVIAAAKDGLVAAALKAKLFADHEEREIQRLSANIVNHQLKRLELKLKQFAEIKTMLMKECEQMERTRQRIAAERALMMSAQFGSNKFQVLNRLFSGYGNSQQMHPQMSMMYGLGPRLPLSAIHPPPSTTSNAMFGSPSNSQQSLGHHPMIRPSLSGTKSGLG